MSLQIRRGGYASGDPTPPPETSLYGPRPDRQAIIDNAGPRSDFTWPSSGNSFSTDAGLRAAVAAQPANSVFIGEPGIYNVTTPWYLTTEHPRIWFKPGSVIDGGVGTHQWVNVNDGYAGSGSGIEVYGGTFQHFGDGVNDAGNWVSPLVIRGRGIVEDAVFRWNRRGILMTGANTSSNPHGDEFRITHCTFYENLSHSMGFSGGNTTVYPFTYILENCHMYGNNTIQESPGGATGDGSMKIIGCRDPILRKNYCHDNWGPGLWTDFSPGNVLVEDNVVEDNAWWGIFVEASVRAGIPCQPIIQYNYCARNGGNANWIDADITLARNDAQAYSSTGLHCANNDIDSTERGIIILDHSNYYAKNNLVYDNRIRLRGSTQSQVGAMSNLSNANPDSIYLASSNNRFEQNYYIVEDSSYSKWHWIGSSPGLGAAKNWTQWRAYEHDLQDAQYPSDGTLEVV